MKPLPFREVKRRLEAAGFIEVAQTGSHVKCAKSTSVGTRTATVPKHREVAAGTLRSILRQAGLNAEQFETAWRERGAIALNLMIGRKSLPFARLYRLEISTLQTSDI